MASTESLVHKDSKQRRPSNPSPTPYACPATVIWLCVCSSSCKPKTDVSLAQALHEILLVSLPKRDISKDTREIEDSHEIREGES